MFTQRGAYGLVCSLTLSIGSLGAGVGCGTQQVAARGQGKDVRGAVVVAADEPKLLLAGPGWLLHVNNERRGPVAVYRAPKREGTAADCGRTGAGAPIQGETVEAHGGASLYVRSDEVICAATARSTRLSWHARPLPAADTQREALATLR